jgi:hypothetical protein
VGLLEKVQFKKYFSFQNFRKYRYISDINIIVLYKALQEYFFLILILNSDWNVK